MGIPGTPNNRARIVGGSRRRHRQVASVKTPSPMPTQAAAKVMSEAAMAKMTAALPTDGDLASMDGNLIASLFLSNCQNTTKLGNFVTNGGADGKSIFESILISTVPMNWTILSAVSVWCDSVARDHHQAAYQLFMTHSKALLEAALATGLKALNGNEIPPGTVIGLLKTMQVILVNAEETAIMEECLKSLLASEFISLLMNAIQSCPHSPVLQCTTFHVTRRIALQVNEALGEFLCNGLAWIIDGSDPLRSELQSIRPLAQGLIETYMCQFKEEGLTEPTPLDSTTVVPSLWSGCPSICAGLIALHESLNTTTTSSIDASIVINVLTLQNASAGLECGRITTAITLIKRMNEIAEAKKRTPDMITEVEILADTLSVAIVDPKQKGEKFLDTFDQLIKTVTEMLHDTVTMSTMPLLPVLSEIQVHSDAILPIQDLVLMINSATDRMMELTTVSLEIKSSSLLVPLARQLRCLISLLSNATSSAISIMELATIFNAALGVMKLSTVVNRMAMTDPEPLLVLFTLTTDVQFAMQSIIATCFSRAGDGNMAKTMALLMQGESGIQQISDAIKVYGDAISVKVPVTVVLRAESGPCGDLVQFEGIVGDDSQLYSLGRVGIVYGLSNLIAVLVLNGLFAMTMEYDRLNKETPVFANERSIVLTHMLNTWYGNDAMASSHAIMKNTKCSAKKEMTNLSAPYHCLVVVLQGEILDLLMSNYNDETDVFFAEMRSFVTPSGPNGLVAVQSATLISKNLKIERIAKERDNHLLVRSLKTVPSLLGGDHIDGIMSNFKQAGNYKEFLAEFIQ